MRADMVTYGKTVAGGLPVGVLCGRRRLHAPLPRGPARPISASRGARSTRIPTSWARCASSSSAWTASRISALYRDLDAVWNERARSLNERLSAEQSARQGREPVHDLDGLLHAAVALQLDVSILPTRGGLALSWVGTGRLIFSLNYTAGGFRGGRRPRSSARPARCSRTAGGGPSPPPPTSPSSRRVLKEMLQARSPWLSGSSISSPRSR